MMSQNGSASIDLDIMGAKYIIRGLDTGTTYHVRVSSENGEGTGRSVATNQEDPLALLSMWRSMSNDPDIQAFRVKRFCRSDAEQRIVFLLWRAGGG